MADGNAVEGGRYLGADGRLHDANGNLLDRGDPDAAAKAEQKVAAGGAKPPKAPKVAKAPKAPKAK